jgi:tetratricopeptide (TPR) repeat protein
MLPEIERAGGTIHIGENFFGTAIDSPTGGYTLAYGMLLDAPQPEDRYYYLLDGERILCRGKTDRRISAAHVGQSGHFVLVIHGSERAESAIIYDRHGRLIRREFFQHEDYWNLLGMTSGGGALFREARGRLFIEELSTGDRVCEFDLPSGFCATGARGEEDAEGFDLCHRGKEWFHFNRGGDLLQPDEFRAHRIANATGPELFGIAQTEFEAGDRTDTARVNEAVRLTEQAFERGIEDSYDLQRAAAYAYLAHLHHLAGHAEEASLAKKQAEAALDGFRLVDRALGRAPTLRNEDEIRAVLADLERALRTPRLHNYPNYLAKLYRCRGELCERLGDFPAAIEAYETALRHNAKAGCKRQLEKLRSATARAGPPSKLVGGERSLLPTKLATPLSSSAYHTTKGSGGLVRTIFAAIIALFILAVLAHFLH